MRILCDGDDEGMLNDDKYWQKDNFYLEPIIVRAAVNIGWFQHRTENTSHAFEIIKLAMKHLGIVMISILYIRTF